MTSSSGQAPGELNPPLVSIIVPIYKVPLHLLRQCIDSILAQTLGEIEAILVDDGSPDECGSICEEYAEIDGRVVCIHKENEGLSAARNTGQRAASAQRIMFVDGDDWIEPDMCERLYGVAIRDRVQLVMCGISKDYAKARELYKFALDEGKVYSGKECKQLQARLLDYRENIATAYAKLIDRSVLSENGIEHDASLRQGAEGLEFNIRLFEHLQSVAFVNAPFYHYIYNSASISASHDEVNHRYVIYCFEKIRTLVEASGNCAELMPWYRNRLLYVIVTTAVSGYFNPTNEDSYATKKLKFKQYLLTPIIREALAEGDTTSLSKQRRAILFFVRHRVFRALDFAGRVRFLFKQYR